MSDMKNSCVMCGYGFRLPEPPPDVEWGMMAFAGYTYCTPPCMLAAGNMEDGFRPPLLWRLYRPLFRWRQYRDYRRDIEEHLRRPRR